VNFDSVPVVVSPALPIQPSHREDARRIVRHGYTDVLAWLGEEVGPKPGELTHALLGKDAPHGAPVLMVSQQYLDKLRTQFDTRDANTHVWAEPHVRGSE
jgi:hypothetical protein